ncbi:aminoacyl-histidine dipeptidase [uncultured Rikenella sp.]|uniref:aminoacyl-histidine dipeptidase n=1 Tax=uncultured Rikenella sp. TaxID=368003 RepID=UPI0025E468C2|nr:aminoacyl-histidine dipeptidase [uncultured Rikenella sp.]
MKEMTELEPKALWKQFAKVCSIPHPSKHEEKLRQYVIDFAETHGLEYRQDTIGNVVVRKAAAKGYEGHPTVILQAHMDMVPQKNSDLQFDFEKDAIRPYVDGDWVTAEGTTLGADDGMGVSAMLAILEADDIPHPALECLFTVDEETGLTGANQLAADMLKGDILINLDSEDEGELYVGCAGAVNVTAHFEYKEEAVPGGYVGYEIALSGLKGGHSGLEIILQRGNANKLLTRFLREQPYARIATIDAGGLRNAIPREAKAVVAVPADRAAEFEKAAGEFEATIRHELAHVEDSIRFGVARQAQVPAAVATEDFRKRFVDALTAMPDGIIRMSDTVPGLVETSTNMSRVGMGDGKAELLFMVRCMVNYGKKRVVAMIDAVVTLAGGRIEAQGDYDGWAPNPDSKILHVMKAGYERLFGKVPEVKAIHAGLECGIIGAKYPKLDMISIGPTMRFPHSPDEKVEIASVAKFYAFLLDTLKNL